jgi:hypothetical protein
MKKFKAYVVIVLLAVLIVPSVALASWWNPFSWHWYNIFNIFSRPQTNVVQNTKQNPADQTANWNTYTNNKYGFSIKYPLYFSMGESGRPDEVVLFTNNDKSKNIFGIQFGLALGMSGPIPFEQYVQDAQSEAVTDFNKGGVIRFLNKSSDSITYEVVGAPTHIPYVETVIKYVNGNINGAITLDINGQNAIDIKKLENKDYSDFADLEKINSEMFSTFKFTGQTQTINKTNTDYKLLKPSQTDNVPPTKYIDDGVVDSGTYAGYHRVVMLQITGEMYSGVSYLVFITQDYKKFYFDSDLSLNSPNSLPAFDQTKVLGNVSDISLNHPAAISLGNFVLVRQNSYSASTFDDFTIGDNPAELSSNTSGLRFFANQSNNAQNNYIFGTTQLKAIDKYGLIFNYNLVSQENYLRQQAHISTDYFENPFYQSIDFSPSFSAYTSYDIPIPGGCGGISSSGYVLKNITADDITPIGTTLSGTQLYTLVDVNHPLNQAEYKAKITNTYETSDSSYAADRKTEAEKLNNGVSEPSYAEYVAKNPIIIFRDQWNRFIAVGEFQYQLMGGCGKPVVYLYPKTPTEVKVVLEKPTRFTVDIPTYKNGWDVTANPDGLLKDLQSQDTDCSAINTQVFGSEYAGDACKNNAYPYLYWAGQVDNFYPQADTGWVVAKENLSSFIDQKLTIIGLNEKERADMLSYWVPELTAKNTPYYRISFFQTADMNKFAPMNIIPKPNTLIRVFLDWAPLANNNVNIQPESLTHIDREGFTAVEWGGLKQ